MLAQCQLGRAPDDGTFGVAGSCRKVQEGEELGQVGWWTCSTVSYPSCSAEKSPTHKFLSALTDWCQAMDFPFPPMRPLVGLTVVLDTAVAFWHHCTQAVLLAIQLGCYLISCMVRTDRQQLS